MKKRAKLMIPFAVISLTAGISAMAFTGCTDETDPEPEHVHTYSEWGHDDAQHWKECPDDGEKDSKTVGNHTFFYGECECGAEKELANVTVTGKIFTSMKGSKITASEGVTLSAERTDGTDAPGFRPTLNADGTYSATLKEGDYTLIFKKNGFKDAKINVSLEKDENLTDMNVTLEYDMFYLGAGWDGDFHDFAHVNDEKPYITMSGKTINVLTNEKFDEVSTTLTLKEGNSTHGWHTQGIWIKFDDGKFMMTRYANKNLQWCQEWGMAVVEEGEDTYVKGISDELYSKLKGDGLDLTLTRVGRNLYVYADGELVSAKSLPVEYETSKAQVGFFDYDSAEGAKFYFDITDEVEEDYEIKVTLPQTIAHGKILTDLEKYRLGDDVILTIAPEAGYTLKSVTANEEDVFDLIEEGMITLSRRMEDVTVTAEFIQQQMTSLSLDILAKKQGFKDGESLNGKKVALKNNITGEKIEITVANDKLEKSEIAAGAYIVQLDGYYDGRLTLAADGTATLDKTLAFKFFTDEAPNARIATHDFTYVNDEKPKIGAKDGDMRVMSTVEFDDVTVTLGIKADKADHDSRTQGIWLKFEDGKYMMLRVENTWFQYMKNEESWGIETVMNAWIDFKPINPMPNAMYDKFYKEGLELKLVRKGVNLYGFVDGKLYHICELPEQYENMKVKVGFFSYESFTGAYWDFSIENKANIDLTTVVKIPEEIEYGTVTADKAEYAINETIKLTLTPDQGYALKKLFINGVNYTDKLEKSGDNLVLTIEGNLENELEVDVMFGEVVYVNLDLAISGLKLGKVIKLEEEHILLKDKVTGVPWVIQVKDGKLTRENIPAGEYWVELGGYLRGELAIPEKQEDVAKLQPVVLEFDTFRQLLGWGDFDFSEQNAEKSMLGASNDCCIFVTKEIFEGNVAASIYLNGKDVTDGNQGIIFRFVSNGMNEIVNIRMEGTTKVQFSLGDNYWGHSADAAGAGWQDLIFFNNGNEKYLEKYNAGTLKLTVYREGATFYVFLDGDYIGQRTFDKKYENAKCEAGFMGSNNNYGMKHWQVDVEDNAARPAATVKLPAADTNGNKVEAEKTTCKVGDKVTLTITPNEEYMLGAITANGKNIFAGYADGKVEFVAEAAEITVVATFIKKVDISLDAAISGREYGVSAPVDLNGETVTLISDLGFEYEIEVANGKLTKTVLAGDYTVKLEGFLTTTYTVPETGTPQAIVLDKALFTGGDNLDYSKINEGKVIGNGSGISVTTIKEYTDVFASAHFEVPNYNRRHFSVTLDFGGKPLRVDFCVQDGGNDMLYQANFSNDGGVMGDFNWQTIKSFTKAEIESFYATGVDFTVIRKGATVNIVFNGEFIKSYTLPAAYADKAAKINFIADDSNGFGFTIKEVPSIELKLPATDANGNKIEASKTTGLAFGEEIALTVKAAEGYELASLKINGKEVAGSVVKGEYKFKLAQEEIEVEATFARIVNGSVNAAISGTKFKNQTVNLNGTVVKLANNNVEYEITVADGKLVKDNVIAGTYTLSAEGYLPVTVEVTKDGLKDAIVLVYNIFTSAPASADLSKLSEGKVTATGNGGVDLETAEKYVDFTAEAKFDVPDYASRRYGIALVFDDGKNFRVDFAVQDGGKNNILQQTNWSSIMFDWQWVDFPEGYFAANNNNYTKEEIESEFIAKGLTYKLERQGATVKLTINGVLMHTYTLPEGYASQNAKLKFIFDSNGTDGTKGFTFDITVPAAE